MPGFGDGGHDADGAAIQAVKEHTRHRVVLRDRRGGVRSRGGNAQILIAEQRLLIGGGELLKGQRGVRRFRIGRDAVAVDAAHHRGLHSQALHVGDGVLPGVGAQVAADRKPGHRHQLKVVSRLRLRPVSGGGHSPQEHLPDVRRGDSAEHGAVGKILISRGGEGVVQHLGVVHLARPLPDHARALHRLARVQADIARVPSAAAEDIRAEAHQIPAHKVGIHRLVQIPVFRGLSALLAQLGIGIKRRVGLEEIRDLIVIDIPILPPVFRQAGLNIIEHPRLYVQRYAAIEYLAVQLLGVGVPGALGNLLPAVHLLHRQGQQMLVVGVFHQDIVGLIPHVRPVAVRPVRRQIGILVDVHPLRGNTLVPIGLVEGGDQRVHIAELHRRVVFQHLDDGALFQIAVEAGHHSVIGAGVFGLGCAALPAAASGQRGEQQGGQNQAR